jgi:hypothetical protein
LGSYTGAVDLIMDEIDEALSNRLAMGSITKAAYFPKWVEDSWTTG